MFSQPMARYFWTLYTYTYSLKSPVATTQNSTRSLLPSPLATDCETRNRRRVAPSDVVRRDFSRLLRLFISLAFLLRFLEYHLLCGAQTEVTLKVALVTPGLVSEVHKIWEELQKILAHFADS